MCRHESWRTDEMKGLARSGAVEERSVRRTILYLLEGVLDLKKRRGRPGRS